MIVGIRKLFCIRPFDIRMICTNLRNLEVVWLSRCSVTDASIPVLSGMTGLKELNVNYTGVTPEGMAKLRAALPSTRFVEAD